MKKIGLIIIQLFIIWTVSYSQPCGVAQSLTVIQQAQIKNLINPLDTALKYEDLFHIDSLSYEIKNTYATQGGRPDATEPYFALVKNVTWVNITNAITLSRLLISKDSMVYVDLWKAAMGLNPPLYQPHSLFLRAAAEIASGLLKIANKETDLTRKTLYQTWATRALDSLATRQLPNGAFPFPDLRTYGDPVFGPIIQNFAFSCGADSVNTIQNGWIVDDKGTGEFKFDAGIIANAFYEAYNYTGKIKYKNTTIAVGNFLKPLKFNFNYNYNTFVSFGLTRAYQLTNDTSYLNRAVKNIRYAVYPGQIANGRWVDGHNANSRYHNLIIQNILPSIPLITATDPHKGKLETMAYLAVKNLMDYTYSCNSATGYRWLMKAYNINNSIIPTTLHDSITDIIGRHINQSAINGKYIDVPTMGEYLELLGLVNGLPEITFPTGLKVNIYPNPSTGFANLTYDCAENENIILSLFDINGKLLKAIDQGLKTKGTYNNQIDLTQYQQGVYFLTLKTDKRKYTQKIIKLE
ncbi:MAG: T9SS type A sorting domain-containing protein [Bacteroidota bacterium]|nr:T9SS type A sorting domain-containing protein [Bacteroidota bacterium]